VPHEGADNQRKRQRTEGRPLAGGAQYVEFPAQFDAEVGLRPTPAVTHCNFNFLHGNNFEDPVERQAAKVV